MPWVQTRTTVGRNPNFRQSILRIYEHKCAVCGWDGRLNSTDLALEAAHIRWHSHQGPDTDDNGLALCAFHHKVFDFGAMCLDDELRVLVSQDLHGGPQIGDTLLGFSGQPILGPQSGCARPSPAYLDWHRTQVFKGPHRSIGGSQ